jgi:formamidopyrimidine-DNA glycosylase
VERLQAEAGTRFPEKVTAFSRRNGSPWTLRATVSAMWRKVLRIRYADNETNYCARRQTGGKVLADRSLSRLFGSEWPRTLEELEALKRQ